MTGPESRKLGGRGATPSFLARVKPAARVQPAAISFPKLYSGAVRHDEVDSFFVAAPPHSCRWHARERRGSAQAGEVIPVSELNGLRRLVEALESERDLQELRELTRGGRTE